MRFVPIRDSPIWSGGSGLPPERQRSPQVPHAVACAPDGAGRRDGVGGRRARLRHAGMSPVRARPILPSTPLPDVLPQRWLGYSSADRRLRALPLCLTPCPSASYSALVATASTRLFSPSIARRATAAVHPETGATSHRAFPIFVNNPDFDRRERR